VLESHRGICLCHGCAASLTGPRSGHGFSNVTRRVLPAPSSRSLSLGLAAGHESRDCGRAVATRRPARFSSSSRQQCNMKTLSQLKNSKSALQPGRTIFRHGALSRDSRTSPPANSLKFAFLQDKGRIAPKHQHVRRRSRRYNRFGRDSDSADGFMHRIDMRRPEIPNVPRRRDAFDVRNVVFSYKTGAEA